MAFFVCLFCLGMLLKYKRPKKEKDNSLKQQWWLLCTMAIYCHVIGEEIDANNVTPWSPILM